MGNYAEIASHRREARHDLDGSLCCFALRLPAELPHAVAQESIEPPRSASERLKHQSNACGVPFLKCGRYGTICAGDGYLVPGDGTPAASFYL